jgi:hypothetical protein
MKYWYTSSALKWLETILQERFGHSFELNLQDANNRLALVLPGHARFITLTLDGIAFSRSDSEMPFSKWDAAALGWATALPGPLPAPGANCLLHPLITETETGFFCGYDILGLTYWMLTRQEEVSRTDLDDHGRFPATASHAYKHGYLERPIVDEWLLILGQVIERTWPGIELKKNQFSMKVSHDVDGPSRYAFRTTCGMLRAMAGDVMKRGDFKSALLAPWVRMKSQNALHPADPANTFDWIMDISERNGLTSAFYFICGRTDPSKDADYEPEHPAIRELMRRIHKRGHEIGLHPSYSSYQTPSIIKHEIERLRRIAAEEGIDQTEWGGRMHYLRWEQPTTLRAWADAGMTYDSTLGYADLPGFRCGTSFEYPAFDPVSGDVLELRVRPLIAMECTVMAPKYMGLGMGEHALNKFIQLKEACFCVNGSFTLLWHNSEFDLAVKRNLYKSIL